MVRLILVVWAVLAAERFLHTRQRPQVPCHARARDFGSCPQGSYRLVGQCREVWIQHHIVPQ